MSSFGDRSFSVAAPTLWNTLPVSLRNTDYILTFKSSLKTYLFKLAFSVKITFFIVFVIIKFGLCTHLVYFDIVMRF